MLDPCVVRLTEASVPFQYLDCARGGGFDRGACNSVLYPHPAPHQHQHFRHQHCTLRGVEGGAVNCEKSCKTGLLLPLPTRKPVCDFNNVPTFKS